MDMLAIQGVIPATAAVMYALYLFFQGLSFRGNARALNIFIGKRSHAMVWNWVQPFCNSIQDWMNFFGL
jgi:hypothetical protein